MYMCMYMSMYRYRYRHVVCIHVIDVYIYIYICRYPVVICSVVTSVEFLLGGSLSFNMAPATWHPTSSTPCLPAFSGISCRPDRTSPVAQRRDEAKVKSVTVTPSNYTLDALPNVCLGRKPARAEGPEISCEGPLARNPLAQKVEAVDSHSRTKVCSARSHHELWEHGGHCPAICTALARSQKESQRPLKP